MQVLKFIRAVVVILAVVMLTVLLGCNNAKPDQEKTQIQREIKNGGQLIYGSLQEPNTLNPLLSDFLSTEEVGRLLFSGLVITNDKGEWIPDLATDVPTIQNGGISADGLTVTYRLRPGVTWHDGVPFTAADVKYTWQFIMNRKYNVVVRDGYDKIASVETPNQYTVIVKYREYYAPHLTLFSVILPKHVLESVEDVNKAPFNRSPVGTGPFKFKEWRLAEAVVLEANPNYYKGRPRLDTIVYKIIPDNNLMLSQIKAGEVDIVSNVSYTLLDQVKDIADVSTVITPNTVWEHLAFNLDNALFQDVRVRQAIALSIDRQTIVNNVLKNVASPAVGDQSPLSWAYNPALKPPARDINKAKELLIQAGWKQNSNGIFAKDGHNLAFSITTTADNKIRQAVVQAIIEQMKEAGIAVEPYYVEPSVFFGDVLRTRRFESAMYAWVLGADPDNMSFWHSRNIPGNNNGYEGQNYPGWRNAEVDKLTEQAAISKDIALRKTNYFRIQELINQDYPVIPLYFRAEIDAVRKTVANYKPNPLFVGKLWNAWEWGIYAK